MRWNIFLWLLIPLLTISLSAKADLHNNELDYASTKDIADINPHLYLGEMAAQNMVFESLVTNAADGSIKPHLAKSWQVLDEGKRYRFNLRQDVSFNDGEKFNAQAVKSNMDAVLANKARHAWMGLVNEIESVNVIDDYTVEVNLYHPYYPTLTELALTRPFRFISPKAFISGLTQNGITSNAGTGPWILKDYKKNQYATFVINPHYWGEKPKLAAVIWHVIPDRQTMLMALQKGDIQLIFGADGDMVDMDSYENLANTGRFTTLMSSPIASRTIVLNSKRPITSDVKVRQALSYAVDKEAIASGILNDSETVADTLMARSVPYSDVSVKTYTYNPEIARKLLDETGWRLPSGKQIREKDGRELRLVFSYDTNNAVEKDIAELLQNDFKQIGIALDIIGEEKQTYRDRQKTGDFDLQYSLSWGKPYDPASFIASFRFSGHADYQAQLGLADKKEIDSTIGKILTSTDIQQRQQLYQWLFTRLADEAIYIPLTYSRTKVIYSQDLNGVDFNISQYEIPFEKMYFKR